MNFIEWLQEIVLSVGMIIAFVLILYYRYPKISSGLNKIFKLKSKKKSNKKSDKNEIKYTDLEKIDLILGTINRIDEKHTVKKAIKRVKEIVG